jgi:arsenite methyltransferase
MRLDDPGLASVFDELPLWSAPFGLKLLSRVRLRPGITVLDLGCGAGFPLLELAQRLGGTARAIGVDPWEHGLARARDKARAYGLANVRLVRAKGERLPLREESVDLLVSNNGLNNVQDLPLVLGECRRVCRPGAQLVATMNLPETMSLFYETFERTLREEGRADRVPAMRRHILEKRRPLEETRAVLRNAGFRVEAAAEDEFSLRFLDGRSLFEHFFIRLGFLEAWQSVVDEPDRPRVFAALQRRLDREAVARGGLDLGIPFACLDCRRE